MVNGDNYHIGGIHLIWWILWIGLLIWFFVSRFRLPGQRSKKDEAIGILKKRLASGEIDNKDYLEKKELIDTK